MLKKLNGWLVQRNAALIRKKKYVIPGFFMAGGLIGTAAIAILKVYKIGFGELDTWLQVLLVIALAVIMPLSIYAWIWAHGWVKSMHSLLLKKYDLNRQIREEHNKRL